MSEKRYYIGNGENCTICDSSKGGSDFFNMLTQYQAVDELNALHEENTKLKSENEMLRTTISRTEAYVGRLTHKSKWSNHSQKVSVEDIIGLVKTDEPTDSVELKKEAYK